MKPVAVIGCGAFGYALGVLLARTHAELTVNVYDIDACIIEALRTKRRHPYFHTDLLAPKNLIAHETAADCLAEAGTVILAVPAQFMRKTCMSIKEALPAHAVLLNIAKALEQGTNLRMSEVIREVLGKQRVVATLSGGMIAKDAIYGAPVGAEIASEDTKALTRLRHLFLATTVHVETTRDIIGVEYGGAFKNVIAIGAGIIDGLGWGASTKAFFVARSLREIEDLSVALGAKRATFHTASNFWMGDLMTTCFGDSRNRLLGELIGTGCSREEAVA
ncbi:hypothetical protein D6789_03325, partial [Candidatus Woesearchaeota archaeon]